MADFRKIDLRGIARRAMRSYGFEPFFPPKVMAAANALDGRAPERAAKSVRDLRHLLWSSIDNFDSEDLDQVEYCERAQSGEILIRVAVADVDAYVPKASTIDMHARNNTTSIYTGIEIYPMLPDRLSKNLSSLAPEQDRLAMVVEFSVLRKGNVRPGKIYRALVRNKAKLVYEQVGAWLEGKAPMPHAITETPELKEQLLLQDEAALRLGKYRAEQGALELETLEARAVVDHEKVLDLVVIEDDRAKRIIENFMIGANGVMSGFLERAGLPTIHRVVRIPKYWKDIVGVAGARGFLLPPIPNALELSKFLLREKKADPERFPDLSLTIVKLLGPGEYVMFDGRHPIGHFCLAVTHYTHSTAPNRRYVDLIIQRLVKAALGNSRTPYNREEISQAAEWCTNREQASKKVERFMVKAEAAVLLAGKIGHIFDAIVTGASEKGTYARLTHPPVEGRIMHQVRGIHVGQKVKVRLVNLDPAQGFVDFELAC
ncbi:MAG: RNB domain-containing ribonuclease [Candidatus Burarchaeum sp.]|nr:RNB domain-containing ribonuclease [Candidatus Burarchaeum sp.]MDO8340186.1 RNB domain-containing ribonuclease [Candidatus Burarchaeum sp.]